MDRGLVDHEIIAQTEEDMSAEPEQVNSADPSFILYTSGTTGKTKGYVRDTRGYLVALNHSLKSSFNTDTEDV